MFLDVKINNVPVQLEVKKVGPASLEDIDEFRDKLRSGDLVLIDQSELFPVEENNDQKISDSPKEEDISAQALSETSNNQGSTNSDQIPTNSEPLPEKLQSELPIAVPVLQPTKPIKEPNPSSSNSQPTTGSPSSVGSQVQQPNRPSELEKPSLIDVAEEIIEDIPDFVEEVKDIFENNQDQEVKDGMKPWYKSKTMISNVLAAIGCGIAMFITDNPETSMYMPASVMAMINIYLRSISKSEIKLPLEDKIKKMGNNTSK